MGYNRYRGSGGRPERVGENPAPPPRPSPLPGAGRPGDVPRSRGGTNARPGGQKPPPDGVPPKDAGPSGHRKTKPPPKSGDLRAGLESILSRLDPGRLETEDLLVLAILWLLYRDSGDKELLIALAAYLFV